MCKKKKKNSNNYSLYNEIQRTLGLYKSGNLASAKKNAEKIARDYPREPLALNILGTINAESGNFQEAIAAFQKLRDIETDNIDAMYNLGQAFSAIGEHKEALKQFKIILETDPSEFDAYKCIADTFSELENFESAIENYKKLHDHNKASSDTYNNLGIANFHLEKYEEANINYTKALELEPNFPDALNNLGNAFRHLNKNFDALNCYKKAVDLAPDYAIAHNNLSYVFGEIGDTTNAIKHCEIALSINPNYFEAHSNRGNIHRVSGNREEALNSYDEALKIKPNDETIVHYRNAVEGVASQIAPKKHIQKVFDDYASKFENHLTKTLEYHLPSMIRKMIDEVIAPSAIFERTIDLGCGTGLVGKNVKNITKTLIGVDLSEKMLAEASKKNIYQELLQGDIATTLSSQIEKFDLFLSADVFIYIGDLEKIFKLVNELSNPKAYFLFSIEHFTGKLYKLFPSGHYRHSENYIENLCSQFDFELVKSEIFNLRKENNEWVKGRLYLLSKKRMT